MQIYLHFLFREEPRAWEGMNRISAAGSSRKIYAEVHVVLSILDGDRHKLIGGQCRKFAANWFTFPERTAKIAVESIFSRGKCPGFVKIWFTFPVK